MKDWWAYLKVVLAIAISFYIESLVFEVNTILAGLFKDPKQLSAHVAMANTSTFFYNIAIGFNISTTVYVG